MKIEEGEGRDEEEFDLSLNYGSSVLDVGEAAPLGQRTCLEIHYLAFKGKSCSIGIRREQDLCLWLAEGLTSPSEKEDFLKDITWYIYIYFLLPFPFLKNSCISKDEYSFEI